CCNLPNGTGCQWKCILAGSPEMAQARLTANTLVIDLTQALGPPPAGQLVEAARTGKLPEKREEIIPFAIQSDDRKVSADVPTAVPQMRTDVPITTKAGTDVPAATGSHPAKPAKDKKKSNDDVSSKGCFWLIIVFFILVTAGMIGGLFWLYGGNLTKENDATALEKTIKERDTEIDRLKQQIENDKLKYKQIDDDNTGWKDAKAEYDKRLAVKDNYLNRVADYFSFFPKVSLPAVSVNVKDGIPRKDGDADRQTELIGFNGSLDRTWNIKDMLTVNAICSDGRITCQLSGPVATYPAGNEVLLGFPWRLYAQKADDAWEPIAEFELVVTENGISVRRFHDDLWNKFVEEGLKKLYDAENNDAFKIKKKLSEWYEANVQGKTFVLDETMMRKINDLDTDDFTDGNADLARLIELRKDYFDDRISLVFTVDVKLEDLTGIVKREKP
ncbi:MAG: phage scaffolding protein, partial [Planctomycetaceae bacterium]|nr:phage scaffolding protein [Planctomycetaceae bacterium]